MITVSCCRPARRPAMAFLPATEQVAARRRLPVDLVETRAGYELRAELPGVAKEDIAVEIADQRIAIAADAKAQTGESEKALLTERIRGRIERVIELPETVDSERATAKHVDGVLYLALPKRNAEHSHRLVVN